VPVPSTIDDLNTSAALNSPSGSDQRSQADNYLRAHAAIIKQLQADILDGDLLGYLRVASGANTATIQAALDASRNVYLDGTYSINDVLTISNDNQCVWMSPRTTITQSTSDKGVFKATQKSNVVIFGGLLIGAGVWSSGWTGVSGHEERGIQLLGCTNSVIAFTRIRNFGCMGIGIIGGSIKIVHPTIEGTHAYSQVLSSGANNQIALYFSNHATYGNVTYEVIGGDYSGSAQGILEEAQPSVAQRTVASAIVAPRVHDIPGQHAFYLQNGRVSIANPVCSNIELSAVKLSSGDANLDMRGYSVTGLVAYNLGSAMFELDIPGTGSLGDAYLSGSGVDVAYGLASTGEAKRIRADYVCETVSTHALYITGADPDEFDVTVHATDVGEDGVLINATNASGIKVRPTIREPNTSVAASGCGVRVASASASVELYDPDVTDADTNMVYGLFN
jgi:hypothetical protein